MQGRSNYHLLPVMRQNQINDSDKTTSAAQQQEATERQADYG
jgi:hypothetical protein